MRNLLALLVCCVVGLSFAQKQKITVVIDPGHGGSDPGHLSANKNHLAEKEINLLIAKKFGAYIEQNLKHVTIIYTRTDDSFPTLDDRVQKANSAQADYFISIHCNANAKTNVHGTESHVHTMSQAKSVKLAKAFEHEFSGKAGRHSRGVKDTEDREHSLQVLKYTNMTGVLVECGFLTNEKEADFLNTTAGQDVIASAIFRGFRTFITEEHPDIAFTKTSTSTTEKGKTNTKDKTSSTYSIQIMSSKDPIDEKDVSFKKLGLPVKREKLNSSNSFKYRYLIGSYSKREDAKKDLEKVQKNGFKDAYIIEIK